VSGHRRTIDTAGLEALIAAAVRVDHIDAEAEQRAVVAFRAARDAGAHQAAGTRRRDDWRPREQGRAGRPLKVTLSVLAASLTLGGVAFAAIGAAGSGSDGAGDDHEAPQASTSGPVQHTRKPSATAPGAGARPDHPSAAQDTEAHCRAYEQVKGRGKTLDAPAWQQLVTAAGGEDEVAAYCAEQLARAENERKSGKGDNTAEPGNSAGDTGNGASNTGMGSGGTGNRGNTGNTGKVGSAGSGSASTGQTGSGSSGADNSQEKAGRPSGGKDK
jgi:hypothetical protein